MIYTGILITKELYLMQPKTVTSPYKCRVDKNKGTSLQTCTLGI